MILILPRSNKTSPSKRRRKALRVCLVDSSVCSNESHENEQSLKPIASLLRSARAMAVDGSVFAFSLSRSSV